MQKRPTSAPPALYQAYLVRLWQDHAQSPWRASAQSVQSGEIVRFATLDALWQFLQQTAGPPTPDHETCVLVRPDFNQE